MIHRIPRALAAALLGALAGPACLVLAYALQHDITFEMDRDLPSIASGFYAVERDGTLTFAWTARRADVSLPGLDRRSPWSCTIRFRGARPNPAVQPDVEVAIDGVMVVTRRATNDFQDLEVTALPRSLRPGLDLTITSSQTYEPGGSDPRALGVQMDRVACRPVGAEVVLPPRRALASAALAAAAFGTALGFSGITAGGAVGATVLLAAGQAIPLGKDAAPYTEYVTHLVWLAVWIGLIAILAMRITERVMGGALRNTARFVAVFSAGALYLKLLGLLHPSKLVIDALFQAHRLEWVLAGRYYFTQPTGGVQFPYAIGLYVFAAPWSALTSDYVTLLRIVVCAADALAGTLLYLMIVRTWGDRLMGAVAVALFHVVPLPYSVIGNANLTNAFGQAVALVTVAAVTVWPLQRRHLGQLIGLVLVATLALLSHVSTFALLLVTLGAVVFWYGVFGGPTLRTQARTVFLATTIAVVLSVVTYYGHFGDVYRMLGDVRARATAPAPRATSVPDATSVLGATSVPSATSVPGAPAAPPPSGPALPVRAANAIAQTVTGLGWPIMLLALVGAWRLWVEGDRDRLVLVLAAWGTAWLAFLTFGILTRVGAGYERYAAEFLGRVDLATYPAAAILAARAGVWLWQRATVWRLASGGVLASAVVIGVREWTRWLE